MTSVVLIKFCCSRIETYTEVLQLTGLASMSIAQCLKRGKDKTATSVLSKLPKSSGDTRIRKRGSTESLAGTYEVELMRSMTRK